MRKLLPASYPLVISLFATISLIGSPPQAINVPTEIFIASAVGIALLSRVPLSFQTGGATLILAPAISFSLIYGLPSGIWATAVGLALGWLAALWRPASDGYHGHGQPKFLQAAYQLGLHVLPLWLGARLFSALTGEISFSILQTQLPAALVFTVLALALHFSIAAADRLLKPHVSRQLAAGELAGLFITEILIIPFVLLGVSLGTASPAIGWLAYAGLPALTAVLAAYASRRRFKLERQLSELATITEFNQTVHSLTELNALWPELQKQLARSFRIEWFYVALRSSSEDQLLFPMAVRHGQIRDWPPHDSRNCLTNQVIRGQKPLLLTGPGTDGLEDHCLPAMAGKPSAWLGVPIFTSKQCIGCLAIFSTERRARITHADRDRLIAFGDSLGPAVEHIQLIEQAFKRATDAENLERTAAFVTDSLDPQEVYSKIIEATAQVIGALHSALYLIDPDQMSVSLARDNGLNESFRLGNRYYQIRSGTRTRCLETERPVLVPDTNLHPEDEFVQELEREGFHAYADFPLAVKDGPIGFLSIFFTNRQHFTASQVALFERFAAQAAIAIANARQHAQTDLALKRRAHKLEILENVGRELSAAIHSQDLFEQILDFALEFTNSPWGTLCTMDAETQTIEIKASRGYRVDSNKFEFSPQPGNDDGNLIKPNEFEQLKKHLARLDLSAGVAQSSLSVPLAYGERVVGTLTLESPEAEAFTAHDKSFIMQLATQAAIAVVNASLYGELQKRLRDQAHLYSTSRRLVKNLQLDAVIESIIQGIVQVMDAQAAGLYLWDPETGAYGLQSSMVSVPNSTHPFSGLIRARQLETENPREFGTGLLHLPGQSESPLLRCPSCQAMIFPLRVREQPLGLIVAHVPADEQLSEDDLQLPRAIAAQGAIALQNALLFTDAKEGRDRLKALLDSVDEGVLMVNAGGQVILVNAGLQRFTRTPLEDMLAKNLTELPGPVLDALGLTKDQSDQLIKNMQQENWVAPSKSTVTLEGRGDERAFERIIAPVWADHGRAIGGVIVLRDVSEAHRLNLARELITQTLVHDLRSPVGAVSSALIVLDDYLVEGDVSALARQSVEIARRGTMRVMNLIDSLLDLARMESGHFDLDINTFDLNDLLQELLEEFIPLAVDVGVVIDNQLERSALNVQADKDKIGRVIANLLDNALKFTPEGGKIGIFIEHDPDPAKIRLCVSDTGPGIPEEYRKTIFDRFSQIPGIQSRKRGTGIGLTFCHLALEAQGERIWTEPGAQSGSVFKFTLTAAPVKVPHSET